jgi:hypothetical protein
MDNSIFALGLGVASSLLAVLSIYVRQKKIWDNREKSLSEMEQDLDNEILEIGFDDLLQTPSGKELISLSGIEKKGESDIPASHQPFVFVLMPLKEQFFDLYDKAIKPALEQLGCSVLRIDEVFSVDSIMTTIYKNIAQADFIVAVVTERNPNVFYEIGYAHALGKNVILVSQTTNEVPFGFSGYEAIIYADADLPALKANVSQRASLILERSHN